jgi:DeoR family fructose operon transcriptional repressor
MHWVERYERVLSRLRADGHVEIGTLARELEVTPETVRRDLIKLEARGQLRRVHGGALPVDGHRAEPPLGKRGTTQIDEKRRIAAAAVRELGDARIIVLDAGTTVAAMVELLPIDRELTVVTNDLLIAQRAAARKGLRVLHTGGEVGAATLAGAGPWATDHLRGIEVDVAFMAASGLSAQRGLTVSSLADAEVKRLILAGAARKVLLADHSKIGDDFFAAYGSLAEIDVLITGRAVPRATVTALKAAGLRAVRRV